MIILCSRFVDHNKSKFNFQSSSKLLCFGLIHFNQPINLPKHVQLTFQINSANKLIKVVVDSQTSWSHSPRPKFSNSITLSYFRNGSYKQVFQLIAYKNNMSTIRQQQKQFCNQAIGKLNLRASSKTQNQGQKNNQKIRKQKQVQFFHANAQQISTNYSSLNIPRAKDMKSWEWTTEQDRELFRSYISNGSKWILIAESFPSKNDNDCKNRFYCCIRKVLKWAHEFQRQVKHKKLISIDSLLTILEIGKFNPDLLDERFIEVKKNIHLILDARDQIIDLAIKNQHQIYPKQVETLVLKLTKLKYSLKFINIKRVKKSACRSREEDPKKSRIENDQENQAALPKETEKITSFESTKIGSKCKKQQLSEALLKLSSYDFQSKQQSRRKEQQDCELSLQITPLNQIASTSEQIELKDSTFYENSLQAECGCILCEEQVDLSHNRILFQN